MAPSLIRHTNVVIPLRFARIKSSRGGQKVRLSEYAYEDDVVVLYVELHIVKLAGD
jgi:hypothetical protein